MAAVLTCEPNGWTGPLWLSQGWASFRSQQFNGSHRRPSGPVTLCHYRARPRARGRSREMLQIPADYEWLPGTLVSSGYGPQITSSGVQVLGQVRALARDGPAQR